MCICSLVCVCVSLLSVSLVFVVCVGFVSSFSCLCPPYVCLSFFLYWFLSFLCFFVSSLFLAVVGFFIRRACSCVCCLSYVCSSLLCLRLLCAVLYLVPVRVVVLLLVGVSGFIGVCVRPLCICLLRLLYFSLVCISLSCRFL